MRKEKRFIKEGQRFGRLVAVKRVKGKWLCVCDCGSKKLAQSGHLNDGSTRSCGCLLLDTNSTHKLSGSRVYNIWVGMLARCNDVDSTYYHCYGGRGISVCDEWSVSPKDFIKWSLSNGYSDDLQVDRIDNDGNYSPDNCRWVTPQVNTHNSRVRSNNKTGYAGVYFNGELYESSIFGKDSPMNGKKHHLGRFRTLKEAVDSRNNFIVKHNLIHKIQPYEEDKPKEIK